MALMYSSLNGDLPFARGKVRDLYDLNDRLLFLASDRISAFDVVLANGIPNKGRLLTQLSIHWFKVLKAALPDLQTHFITAALPPQIPAEQRATFEGRSMQVRKLKVIPIEAIVRGYLTGSAWNEYRESGTVHEIQIPEGMQEGEAFPEPLYTPSTKAEPGEKDVNIHPDNVPSLIKSPQHADRIKELSLKVYTVARGYAAERGIIMADTKFEFGLDQETDEVVLIDEVCTPDSSRFWPQSEYKVGQAQKSFDKQDLRDWLVKKGLKGTEGVEMPDEVVQSTWARYKEAYERLVGEKWVDN